MNIKLGNQIMIKAKLLHKIFTFKNLAILVFFVLVVFTRFYNLEGTTRFTRDESQNLLDMYDIFKEREITFVGPINYGETIVYPSTTFYMLLPFAALGNFEAYSPALGTAFYGVITVILILLVVKKMNEKIILPVALLSLVWFPLLETSRWAWNPHLVPFTTFAAIFLFFQKRPILRLLSGFLFGLSFHLHYLSVVSFSIFVLISCISSVREKKFKDSLFLWLGFLIAMVPFVIFDLRNPPGLFFTHYVKNNLVSAGAGSELALFPKTFVENISNVIVLIAQSKFLAKILGILFMGLLIFDLRKNRGSFLWLAPIIGQIVIISFLPFYENRYFYLGLPFFVVWLSYPRKNWGSFLAKAAVIIMIVGSLFSVKRQLTEPIRVPDTRSIRLITSYIRDEVRREDRKNVNVAVLASPDRDPLGVIYRHVLKIKGVSLLGDNQFDITDNLFVITTSEAKVVRRDPANVMTSFRNGKIAESYEVDGTEWKIYLFNRY